MRFKAIITVLFCVLISKGYTQMVERPLKIGDVMPDLVFKSTVNTHKKTVKLSDYKGKLIIFDVWNKYCTACIEGFPAMQELQKKYPNDLQVILITEDKKEDYMNLLNKSLILPSIKLPFIFDDKSLSKIFTTTRFPMHVWIDSNMIIKAVTAGYNTTPENIDKYLSGMKLDFRMKENENLAYDYSSSLLMYKNISKKIIRYSILTKSLNDLPAGTTKYLFDSTGKRVGIKIINVGLKSLLLYAFGNSKEIIMEFTNSERYRRPANKYNMDKYKEDYTFCYEAKVLSGYKGWEDIRNMLRKDIEDNFNIQAVEEERQTDCYELIKINNLRPVSTAQGELTPFVQKSDNRIILQNAPIKALVESLESLINKGLKSAVTIPVYNCTDFDGNVNLDLKFQDRSIEMLNAALSSHGLKLVSSSKIIDYLVIKDRQ